MRNAFKSAFVERKRQESKFLAPENVHAITVGSEK